MTSTPTASEGREPALTSAQKRLLALLGLPTFAFALAITVLTTYLPLLLEPLVGSTAVIGVIVSAEGAMAVCLPLAVGAWSDRLTTPLGGRLPFLLVGAPLMALSLAVVGLLGSVAPIVVVVVLFFAAYFLAYEPYRALYPDLLPEETAGRGQSTQALWRGAGTGLALLGGGLLFSIAEPLPFLVAAVLALVSVGAFAVLLLRRGLHHSGEQSRSQNAGEAGAGGVRAAGTRVLALLREHAVLRAYLMANALWEMSLAALKTFVILYLTVGLGFGTAVSALIVGAGAVFVLGGVLVTGKLADRFGRMRVLGAVLPMYGVGLLVPFVTDSPWILVAIIPVVAAGGGAVMTLPYALLIPLMPEDAHGVLTGFYSASRGLGIMLGPLLAGVAIATLPSPAGAAQGYASMWIVCAAAILASLPFLARLRGGDAERRELREA